MQFDVIVSGFSRTQGEKKSFGILRFDRARSKSRHAVLIPFAQKAIMRGWFLHGTFLYRLHHTTYLSQVIKESC
jgi:hypothetical protein